MSKMKPILCNTEVVKNIMAGRQTQDRRPLKVQPPDGSTLIYDSLECYGGEGWAFQYPKKVADGLVFNRIFELPNKGKLKRQPGDILGLRERARVECQGVYESGIRFVDLRYEDGALHQSIILPDRIKDVKTGHCLSNGCFKEAIRTFIKVKRVWIERVQDISDLEARLEGISRDDAYECNGWSPSGTDPDSGGDPDYRMGFRWLWESIYPGSWERNEWVECCEFELCDKEGNSCIL